MILGGILFVLVWVVHFSLPTKYRVMVQTSSLGNKWFYPQYKKGLGMWMCYRATRGSSIGFTSLDDAAQYVLRKRFPLPLPRTEYIHLP